MSSNESVKKVANAGHPIKEFRILLNRLDEPIRDSTPYTEGFPRVVGEPNPPSDWRKKLEAKAEAMRPMDRTATLSNHKLITRRNKCRIEVLMPEPTRGRDWRHFDKKATMIVTEQIERKHMFDDK